jgi:hypothetical protein
MAKLRRRGRLAFGPGLGGRPGEASVLLSPSWISESTEALRTLDAQHLRRGERSRLARTEGRRAPPGGLLGDDPTVQRPNSHANSPRGRLLGLEPRRGTAPQVRDSTGAFPADLIPNQLQGGSRFNKERARGVREAGATPGLLRHS